MEIPDVFNNAGRCCTITDDEIISEVTFQNFGKVPKPRSFVILGSDENGNYLIHEDIEDVLYHTKGVTDLW